MLDSLDYERLDRCKFSCEKICSLVCCNGATVITIDEIKDFYKIFPIYIGFRKYSSMNREHRSFLKNIGGELDDYFIIGDFIAGNRFKNYCLALDTDNLCRLQKEGKKPLQCQVVPFCAVFPENMQDIVFLQQRQLRFSKCQGYKESNGLDYVVWQDGFFTESSLRDAFYNFQKGLSKQSKFMKEILLSIYKEDFFKDFMEGEGILEMPIPIAMLFPILYEAGFSEEGSLDFILTQTRICQRELNENNLENTVIEDWFNELLELLNSYVKFIKSQNPL
ncbi:MAG: hypothetical protein N3A59_05850 [Thermodesulfovibrionales bacterium]|nr:hypothetical protein [Thermodesulfovibrionales bacterium]